MASVRKSEAVKDVEAKESEKDKRIVDRFYTLGASDTRDAAKIAGATISIAEFEGDRQEQEDTYAYNSDPRASATAQFKFLKQPAQFAVLQNLFGDLNRYLKHHTSGATVCMVIAWLEEIPGSENQKLMTFTVNQGDASAFFSRVNANNEVIETVRLNKDIHDPESIMDNIDVNYDYGPIARLGTVAVARALGNSANAPLNRDFHVADIRFQSFVIKKDETVYITNGCDGLTEVIHNLQSEAIFRGRFDGNKKIPLARFKDAVLSYQGKTIALKDALKRMSYEKPLQEFFISQAMQASLQLMAEAKESRENIAYHLAQWGYILATDNITDLVMIPGKVPVFTAVFDGHGGKEAATDAVRVFENGLKSEVQRQYNVQWQEMIAEIKQLGKLTEPQLLEHKHISKQHVGWMLSQLVQIESLVAKTKKSSKFFVAANPNAELEKLTHSFLPLYRDEFFLQDNAAKAEEIFFKMLDALLQTWDGFCKSSVSKAVAKDKEAKSEAPVTTTDIMNFLYCNSGSCVFQHGIGCLLQSVAAVCRQFNWKDKTERAVLDKLLQFPDEPVLKNAGFLSSVFGLKC